MGLLAGNQPHAPGLSFSLTPTACRKPLHAPGLSFSLSITASRKPLHAPGLSFSLNNCWPETSPMRQDSRSLSRQLLAGNHSLRLDSLSLPITAGRKPAPCARTLCLSDNNCWPETTPCAWTLLLSQ